MDTTEATIWTAYLAALHKMQDADNQLSRLSPSVRTFFLVHAAQGVIDNGGYRYFFEEDWPENRPYDDFISAYETIGCHQQATELRRVVATFPFSEPHLHKDKRQAFIDSHYDKCKYCVPEWGNALCGDKEVFENLVRFYKKHEKDFD